jgi:hypothetical protein
VAQTRTYSRFPYLGRFRIAQIGGGGAKPETSRRNTETNSSWKTGGMRQFPYLRRFRMTQMGGGGAPEAVLLKYGKREYIWTPTSLVTSWPLILRPGK